MLVFRRFLKYGKNVGPDHEGRRRSETDLFLKLLAINVPSPKLTPFRSEIGVWHMRSFSLRPFASASARCRSGHRTREWESHDTQHPQFSYYDPSQSSLKHYPSIQPGPVPPSLDIPPEPNITGSLLVKPAEFLSKAALTFGRRPEPTARYYAIA